MSTPLFDTPEHFPMEVDAQGRGPVGESEAHHVSCWCAEGSSWPCAHQILQITTEHPGISTDDLIAAVQAGHSEPAARRDILDAAHRGGRSLAFGQLDDGTWWTADANKTIAAHCADDRPSPGAQLYWHNRSLGLERLLHEVQDGSDPRA